MGNRSKEVDYRQHIDPEYRRWGKTYPRFPGVAECVRLLRARNVRGSWVDIVTGELAAHASENLPEMTARFCSEESEWVRLILLMAITEAKLPAAIPFLMDVMRGGDARLSQYAEKDLSAIGTRESREALWIVKNP